MTILSKKSSPTYSLDVSEEEKARAKQIRDKYSELRGSIKNALEHLEKVFNAVEPLEDPSQFARLINELSNFKAATKNIFDGLFRKWSEATKSYAQASLDAEMREIVEVINAEITNVHRLATELIETLGDPGQKSFPEEFKKLLQTTINKLDAISSVIYEQLFSHIDRDILSRIVLGHREIKLSR